MYDICLIIITGPPGAGKTTLARSLSQALNLPLISKDDVKDILFDTLGWKDRQWSMKLGEASFEILFHLLECQLKANKSAVVETAFIPQYHNERFLDLLGKYDFRPMHIVCTADYKVLYERFIKRTKSNERHPGHVDHLMTYDQFVNLLSERKYASLDIEGSILEIDTTDFNTVDYEGLLTAIQDSTSAFLD